MRRMYSEQELTRVIKAVFDEEIESGALDQSIADYVDAYLVEHPVDITALEGQDIAPKDINATGDISANSFSGENAKPLYWHGIELVKSGETLIQLTLILQTATKIETYTALDNWVKSIGANVQIATNGVFTYGGNTYKNVIEIVFVHATQQYTIYFATDSGWSSVTLPNGLEDLSLTGIDDNVNKLNG